MSTLRVFLVALCLISNSVAFADADAGADKLSEAAQKQNLYNVALAMENKMKAKLATLQQGTPEYLKLKANLDKVSANRYGLGRAIPGSDEAKQEAANPTGGSNSSFRSANNSGFGSAPSGGSYQGSDWAKEKASRESILKGIWEETFNFTDKSYGSFYMFQFNDLDRIEAVSAGDTQDWLLMQMPVFEISERLNYQTNISASEKAQFAKILRNVANRGYPTLRNLRTEYIPFADQQLFSQLGGGIADRGLRETLLTAYVSGMNPLNMPYDMYYQGFPAQSFLSQLASRATRDPEIRMALINLYLCTRVQGGDERFVKLAAHVEAAYKKYVRGPTCAALLGGPASAKGRNGFLGGVRQLLLGR